MEYFNQRSSVIPTEGLSPSGGTCGLLSVTILTKATFLAKRGEQIPHRLKPVRDDKNKGLPAAYLKVRPFKSAIFNAHLQVFPQAVVVP